MVPRLSRPNGQYRIPLEIAVAAGYKDIVRTSAIRNVEYIKGTFGVTSEYWYFHIAPCVDFEPFGPRHGKSIERLHERAPALGASVGVTLEY